MLWGTVMISGTISSAVSFGFSVSLGRGEIAGGDSAGGKGGPYCVQY
jgi:hypothetical protein